MEGLMWRLCLGISALASAVTFAQTFTFTVGSPVAAQDGRAKQSAFVVRTEGCADPAKLQVDGTAEGLVQGARRSVALRLAPMSTPGVYAVFQTWPAEGDWVVNLRGTCIQASAGAVIPLRANTFIRASSTFFPRPATAAEVDAALHTLLQGRDK
jgi:hypothetical protein